VVSAARTIMSSSFSRPSTPDFAMLVSLFFAVRRPHTMQQTRHRRRLGLRESLRWFPTCPQLTLFPGDCSAVHVFA
jgi:hypothetical protein